MPYRRNNYDFVIDSSFQPFSMQEMLVPFTVYKDAYEKSEAAYDELSQKAGDFEYLASTLPEGSKARDIYEGYANDLKAQAADLSHNGLSMNNRRALSSLKQRYEGEIGRLKKIDTIRRAQIEEQRKLALQDPTRLFSREAAMTSFDDYLDNPDLSYNSYSGALLAQQVGQAASTIAKSLSDYGKGKPLDGFTKTWLQQHGYSAADVAAAIQNPASDTSGILSSIVEQAVQSSGIPRWADVSTLDQAYQYARQGLWNAVGQTNVATYTDEAAKLAAQEESNKRVAANPNATMSVAPKFDRRNVRTSVEIAADVKDKEMLAKYGQYFVLNPKTGSYSINADGRKIYRDSPYKYRGAYSTATDDASTEFKDWIDSRGLSEMAKGRTGKGQSAIVQSMLNRSANLYDVNTAGEYIGLIDSSQYDNVIGALNRASIKGTLKNYDRRKKGNSYEFVPTDDVDVSKLTNADIKSAVPVYGIHGNFLEVTLKDGNKIIVPYNNLNNNYNSMVSGNVNDAYALEMLKQQGMETFTYGDGRTVPIDVAITDALNQGYDNFMSGLGTSTVEPQKTARGLYQIR